MDRLVTTLDAFFSTQAPADAGDLVVVAFSGGADSTALLAGLVTLAARRPLVRRFTVLAAHLDHGLDPGSPDRAAQAEKTARELAVPFVAERCEGARRGGENLEEAARRVRYGFLADVANRHGARWVATAHHRDDLAETVVLRLLQGTGLDGLAAILPCRGTLVRPLLAWSRAELAAVLARLGLATNDDPTNRDETRRRAFVRHRLLPHLARSEGDAAALTALSAGLARLAAAAGALRPLLDRRLLAAVDGRAEPPGFASCSRVALTALAPALREPTLAALHRLAGLPRPLPASTRAELFRQLAAGGAVGAEHGAMRWSGRPPWQRGTRLLCGPREATTTAISYTLPFLAAMRAPS